MIGDTDNMISRLRALLPRQWFPVVAPNLDAFLSMAGAAFAHVFDLLGFVKLQARIKTASGLFLDLAALDFFGRRYTRAGRTDDEFRLAIPAEITRERLTGAGITRAVTELTHRDVHLYELWNPATCGGYDCPTWGYGVAGHWGSDDYPAQFFADVLRQLPNAVVAGYDCAEGAYDIGSAFAWDGDPDAAIDSEIYATVARTVAAGVVAWVRILDNFPTPEDLAPEFYYLLAPNGGRLTTITGLHVAIAPRTL